MWVIESRDLEFTGGVSKETQEITNDSAGLSKLLEPSEVLTFKVYKGIYKGSTVAIKFITVSSQTEEEEFRKEFETLWYFAEFGFPSNDKQCTKSPKFSKISWLKQ